MTKSEDIITNKTETPKGVFGKLLPEARDTGTYFNI
jgi:hypothetical protein